MNWLSYTRILIVVVISLELAAVSGKAVGFAHCLAPRSHLSSVEEIKSRLDDFASKVDFFSEPDQSLEEFLTLTKELQGIRDEDLISYVQEKFFQKYLERVLYGMKVSKADPFYGTFSALVNTKYFSSNSLPQIYKKISFALKVRKLWKRSADFIWGAKDSEGAFPQLKVAIFDWGQTLSPLSESQEKMGEFFKMLQKKHGLKICVCTAGVTVEQIRNELGRNASLVHKIWSTESKASTIQNWMDEEGLEGENIIFADDELKNFSGFRIKGDETGIASIKIVPLNELAFSNAIRGYITSFKADESFDEQLELWDRLLNSLKGSPFNLGKRDTLKRSA